MEKWSEGQKAMHCVFKTPGEAKETLRGMMFADDIELSRQKCSELE